MLSSVAIKMAEYRYDYPETAERIRWHREHVGLTQQAYGLSIGATRTQVKNWEAGMTRPKAEIALRMCERYYLTMDFIYRGNVDALPPDLREAWRSRSD